MSKKVNSTSNNKFELQAEYPRFAVYKHSLNDLTVIHYPKPETGVITTNITYKVGSVDEKRGESGLAHMLEHMLFKPTKQDLKQNLVDSSAMVFERETGSILNANTSYDRTTYYFSFPKPELDRVLKLESERMQHVVLSDEQFQPERGNVLSEFDMYNGDPYFALEVVMRSAAFQSHAYDHEVIGTREDIEDYTTDKLQRFYNMYYQPNNAVLMIVGDITTDEALAAVEKRFGNSKNRINEIERETAREPRMEGGRTVTVARHGTTNILSIGFHHAEFPSKNWCELAMALEVLAGSPESILYKKLVDTGLVTSLTHYQFQTAQPNMGMLFCKLAPNVDHDYVKKLILETIYTCKVADIASLLKREKVKSITDQAFLRSSSLGVTQELTEYVVGDNLDTFDRIEEILRSITAANCIKTVQAAFEANKTITGYYKSL